MCPLQPETLLPEDDKVLRTLQSQASPATFQLYFSPLRDIEMSGLFSPSLSNGGEHWSVHHVLPCIISLKSDSPSLSCRAVWHLAEDRCVHQEPGFP